ncbi:MAG: hypothetical protein A3H76_06015 [Candidatus Lloydbacteria bacterium RIFCSPLOWO2_02_FULL_54_12]|nr:MAG: hypothetical protein A3H76_06015 [Candidatus Lloydbacteria bacterium RIFCSPLOWO2_02_FULL_54_12]
MESTMIRKFLAAVLCSLLVSANAFAVDGLTESEWTEAKSAATQMLTKWLTDQDITGATLLMTAPDHRETKLLAPLLALNGRSGTLDIVEWRQKFLICFLMLDHGTCASLLGHGIPGSPEYAKCPATMKDALAQFGAAMFYKGRPPEISDRNAMVFAPPELGGQSILLVGFSLPYLHRESLMVVMLKENGRWKPAFVFIGMVS